MLTHRQKELLDFIRTRLAEAGVSPSFEEMKSALGLHSKSGVHRMVLALEERGFISRLPDRARAIEVISPEDRRMDHGVQKTLVDALHLARSFVNERNYPSVIAKIDDALRRATP